MKNIKVYTTTFCPFCIYAKKLLETEGYDFEEINLDQDSNLRVKLSQENKGWRTVPMIFIEDEFIGGFQELAKLKSSGDLQKKVNP